MPCSVVVQLRRSVAEAWADAAKYRYALDELVTALADRNPVAVNVARMNARRLLESVTTGCDIGTENFTPDVTPTRGAISEAGSAPDDGWPGAL